MLRHASNHALVTVVCSVVFLCAPARLPASAFTQTNLVSNVPGLAEHTDPNLVNPWGVSSSATSPFWVSDQGTGVATLYDGAGNITPLVVSIPGSSTPPSGPTGQVFNSTTGFVVGNSPAHFIFDTLNGTIAGWNSGTSAVTMASTPEAVYTGLAIDSTATATYLYAADSAGGAIHVFNSSWTDVTGSVFAGKFVDPNPVAGYVPFNVQTIGSNIYVTYAQLTSQGTGLPGGYVDEFDANGNFITRIATNGPLYAPWGITLAPSEFGPYSNDLLIGNFGNGEILAYNPTTDMFLGALDGPDGSPIVDPFLWALIVRTGGTNVNTDALYLTAGIDNQQDGLFAEIAYTPEPSTLFETGSAFIGLLLLRFRRK
ncbi:MAG TPA: TIGR03118 family protein [Acidobacteriaceae bacterium]|nr:TIGR03118 family protein [Acidobacteriaceae bacterium]